MTKLDSRNKPVVQQEQGLNAFKDGLSTMLSGMKIGVNNVGQSINDAESGAADSTDEAVNIDEAYNTGRNGWGGFFGRYALTLGTMRKVVGFGYGARHQHCRCRLRNGSPRSRRTWTGLEPCAGENVEELSGGMTSVGWVLVGKLCEDPKNDD